MKQIRVAFIGAGGIAARHIQALQAFDEVDIVAISSPSPNKAEALAAKCGPTTRAYSSYMALLDKESLDALYICTPPFAHGALELAALERNIPIFVEKPLSSDAETAEKIFEAVQAASVVTAVGYQWRYLDTTELTQSLLAENAPHLVLGYWLDALPPPDWWAKETLSGGQMVEQTTHLFDLARLLVGEIKRVYALGQRFGSPDGIDRVATATVEFANGAVGSFSNTSILAGPYRRGLELFCERRTIALSYQELRIEDGPGLPPRLEKVQVDPFVRENRDFLDAVANRTNQIRCDYAEALRTHRVTQAIQRSIREKRSIDL